MTLGSTLAETFATLRKRERWVRREWREMLRTRYVPFHVQTLCDRELRRVEEERWLKKERGGVDEESS